MAKLAEKHLYGRKITIQINNNIVSVPKSQEQKYRDALADQYFNGYRVYVEGGHVKFSAPQDSTGTDLETLRMMLKDQNRKIFALRSQLYDF